MFRPAFPNLPAPLATNAPVSNHRSGVQSANRAEEPQACANAKPRLRAMLNQRQPFDILHDQVRSAVRFRQGCMNPSRHNC